MYTKSSRPEKVIRRVSSVLIKSSWRNAQSTIQEVLAITGMWFDAQRVTLIYHNTEKQRSEASHQWFSHVDYQSDDVTFVSDKAKGAFSGKYAPGNIIINFANQLEDKDYQKALQQQNIQSMLVLPLAKTLPLSYSLQIDHLESIHQWTPDKVHLAETLCSLLGDYLERVEKHKQIQSSKKEAQTHNTPIPEEVKKQIEILSEAGIDLLHMETKEQIFSYCVSILHRLFDNSIVSLSEYSQPDSTMVVRHLKGVTAPILKSARLLGFDPVGRITHLNPDSEDIALMKQIVFHKLQAGLYEATLGEIPKSLARALEKLTGIKAIYGSGFFANGQLYGTALICLRQDQQVLHNLMESFTRTVSMALYRAETNQQLRQSRKEMHDILSGISEGVVKLDMQGTITYANQATCQLTGYDHNELMGMQLFSLAPRPVNAAYMEKQVLGHQSAQRKTITSQILCKNQQIKTVRVSINQTCNEEATPSGYLAVLSDITEQVQQEKAMFDMEIQQRTLEIKQHFLSNMSHEMLTPINGISGVAELLLDSDLSQENQELVSIINQSSEQLLTIIKSIWETMRLKEGVLRLHPKEFGLCDLLHQQMELFSASARQKGMELLLDCLRSKDYLLLGDIAKINQVLSNLVGNAIKFHPGKGRVILRSEIKTTQKDAARLRFTVIDDGPGVPENSHDNLFKLFEQADNSYTRQNDGLGLGLHIAKELVDLMNGKIGFENTGEQGAVFWFEVPVKVCHENDIPEKYACRNRYIHRHNHSPED